MKNTQLVSRRQAFFSSGAIRPTPTEASLASANFPNFSNFPTFAGISEFLGNCNLQRIQTFDCLCKK